MVLGIPLENFIENEYLRALALLIILLLLIRFVFSLIIKIVIRLTKKTKTNLDDILIKKSSRPLTIIAFFIGFQITLFELTLTENLRTIISRSISTLIIIVIGYLIYVFLDTIVIHTWRKIAAKTKSTLDDNLTGLTHTILKIALISLAFLYVLDTWGVQIGPLLAGLGIAGIAVALALQPVLANIFSGASIILDKSVSVGDLVYLKDDTQGKILKVGLRSTKIRTFDNELIIIPNSKLAESTIQNVALPEPKTRVIIPFSVSYGSDIKKVKSLILKEINSLKHLEKNPEPSIKFMEMADSSLNFNAYFYVDTFENRLESRDEANTKIYNALNKAGIEIPFPQRDVHLKKK